MTSDNITVIMKPTNQCNLRCKYCYHADNGYDKEKMTDQVLEKAIAVTAPFFKRVEYNWHGGEPLIMGLDFYERVLYYQKKYRQGPEHHIINTMQTNGTLITDDWIKLFSEYFVSIGISVDGADYESNKARFSDEKIYKKMISNLDLVLNSNLYTSIFITLGRHNIDKIDEIFKFIEEKKPNGFYINPIKKKIGNELSVNEWLEIIEKMDEFSKRTGIENSLTPQIQRAINGEIPSLCMLNGACNKFINMNVDGEIFKTCVFQSQSNYLGNIDEDNIKNKIIEYIQIPSLDSC